MGIRGLTTFINNRAHLYLKDHELHDCNVVLDGNSMASNLYKWHCRGNDCFGGDYDKFANVIRKFFENLSTCNITPYIILDGGYEKRKIATVISRMKSKIRAAHNLSAPTEGIDSVFPLFLREVFVDVVLGLNLKVARSNFEGDMELAGVAKALNCPVISYDSDFYIFGCLYIPFSTVDLTVRKGKNRTTKNSFSYLSCKIYHIDAFLKAFGGLERDNLPLLAVLLGNDYVKGSFFTPFFRNLKIQKCSGNQSDQQKRIKSLIVWLQNETPVTAIPKIVGRFKNYKKRLAIKIIERSMKGYFDVSPELLDYLGIKIVIKTDMPVDFKYIANNLPKESNDEISEENESEYNDDSDEDANFSESDLEMYDHITAVSSDQNSDHSIEIFQESFRKCQYPACFMDLFTQNKYYCIPQVEDSFSEHSHTISLSILSLIHAIVTPNKINDLTLVCRSGNTKVKYCKVPRDTSEMPTLAQIKILSIEEKKQFLMNSLKVDKKVQEMLNLLPVEWHLLVISLSYALSQHQFDRAFLYSVCTCFFTINYIDPVVDFYRVSKTFEKKFGSLIASISTPLPKDDVKKFSSLPKSDCIVFMHKMISYFQMNSKLKANYKLYDKSLVHLGAEIQSVFLHVKYLNALLSDPFPRMEIHKIFDGTFIYNLTVDLRKRTNVYTYLDILLKDVPNVLNCVKHILSLLDSNLSISSSVSHSIKKSKKRKGKKVDTEEDIAVYSSDEDVESLIDPNNPYSLLAVFHNNCY